ncbi:PAS domain-containing sensor histidine kinase [Lewinella sp. JB7]|uniref:PAS domain-containing sensor histidine kinase n=1 Tax=Lewinella sp. JB7 TaxID=2962887 RepID=UPI0020C976C9|nr:PAS domain-containing sensor histidine kinase [Lewinella sp. JB7]MCP9234586.1 PAS domain-containing sensor histidine kinase [Lewinella sp. JB7]
MTNDRLSQDESLRLKALFEMATDGIITMNKYGVIENVNRAAGELFGYTPDELRGQKVNILMAEYDRTHHDEYLERYQRTHVPHIIGIGREVTGRCKDGREFPLRLAVSEVRLDSGILYTGMLHDLSSFKLAQKRVEDLNRNLEDKVRERTAELRRREEDLRLALGKERELNELKSRFLSMASHEFKTPLSTVLSSIELIELYRDSAQQPKRERHIHRIKDAVGQLIEILNDFLSLSQLEQGEVPFRPQTVNLRSILSSSIESSEGQFSEGQEISLRVDRAPDNIVTDPKLLRHALINLISNAAKYSPGDGRIEVGVSGEADRVSISVRDYGIGIPEEDQAYLFDRFFRARNVENIKGSGLGLNIVSHYTKLLHGELEFTSELGTGSTFTLRLPIQPDHGTTD